MQYPVNEIFQTIQGEGHFTGVAAIFLRLQGCPVGCSWCDTKHTWEVDPANQVAPQQVINVAQDQPHWAYWSTTALVDLLTGPQYQAKHIVITGGEPCLYDLTPLTQLFAERDVQCQIETSGCYPVLCDARTWVTVSPKLGMKGGLDIAAQALERANEIKHPVAKQSHIEQLDQLLAQTNNTPAVALQPISQQKRATQLCIDTCIERNWRLSVQLHKYLSID
ncbi:7-carboxy-7-deazaguanine synthase QueE [Ferrimonas lipolytica]|uniref:7-carboxy-7-deazaguanine synthase n=1 Tax=Ferrimonas lipolytica TaxID=2724191 RepID=A0A6H1UCV4_9GAMM|nr:7-carboxy-7-deazaguanine synthase QueE [Ferrimonas lipolytica]QIZ76036.1 7-carboxy-7-deazaguanine synthase QueE [Ferrimonas lipolytica]